MFNSLTSNQFVQTPLSLLQVVLSLAGSILRDLFVVLMFLASLPIKFPCYLAYLFNHKGVKDFKFRDFIAMEFGFAIAEVLCALLSMLFVAVLFGLPFVCEYVSDRTGWITLCEKYQNSVYFRVLIYTLDSLVIIRFM